MSSTLEVPRTARPRRRTGATAAKPALMKNMLDVSAAHQMHHGTGVEVGQEISFFTRFDYLFPALARSEESLIKAAPDTPQALKALGEAMFEDEGAPDEFFNSSVPAIFTYLGQFIDHDLTARTDRNGEVTKLEDVDSVARLDPDVFLHKLFNGRRPQLDLDSVYADGPGLISNEFGQQNQSVAEEFGLYERRSLKLRLQQVASGGIDLPRVDGRAQIADMRNDENLIVGQLHAAFLAFHNAIADTLRGTPQERYIEARRRVRWAYQYIVANEYLPTVCAPAVVRDVLLNGPRHFGPGAGHSSVFMPLEFSVAAFRFGHSMIRPSYQINGQTNLRIDQIFFPGKPENLDGTHLKEELLVEWDRFAPGGQRLQFARRFDHRLSPGLANLTFETNPIPALRMLAVRNLLRGYNLSIPTGQAVAKAVGLSPLPDFLLRAEDSPAIGDALARNDFLTRTPLWYYVLREAGLHGKGQHLGAIGSLIVAETLIGMMKQDPTSYLNNRHHPAVTDSGIDTGAGLVDSISDLLRIAGVL